MTTTDQALPVTRATERGAATRSGLLAAAREVFTSQGYAQAAVLDIVARAGASVGSMYHHFSGKADLYFTLYQQVGAELAEQTRRAVRRARDAGVTDPLQLFLAGARAYLEVCAEQRDLAALFAHGDGPPGFERRWRSGVMDWVSNNTGFLARDGEPDAALSIVMTGAMMAANAEVSLAPDARRARQVVDGVIAVLSRLGSPG